MTTIRLDAVARSFGAVRAVDDISLTIAEGEFFTLLGPSGCGKTTLLRMIAGFCEVEAWLHLVRRPAHRQPAGASPQHRHGVPELRDLPQPHRRGQRRLRSARPQGPDRPTIRARVGEGARTMVQSRRTTARAGRISSPAASCSASRSPAPRDRAGGAAVRRALVQSRRATAHADARRDPPVAAIARPHRRLRHARPGGGAGHLGPDRRPAPRPDRAGRAAGDDLSRAADGLRGRVPGLRPTCCRASSAASTAVATTVERRRDGVLGWMASRATPGSRVLLSIRPETLRLVTGPTPPRSSPAALREFLGPMQRLHATLPDGTMIRISALGGQALGACGRRIAHAGLRSGCRSSPIPRHDTARWACAYRIGVTLLALAFLARVPALSAVRSCWRQACTIDGTGAFSLAQLCDDPVEPLLSRQHRQQPRSPPRLSTALRDAASACRWRSASRGSTCRANRCC